MRITFLLLVLSLISKDIYSQLPQWQWAQLGTGPALEHGLAVETDAAGNVYVAGSFTSNPYALFGNDTLLNISGYDIFLAKYDAAGNLIWTRTAGGTAEDSPNDIHCDAGGNIYLTGVSKSPSISFGNIGLTGNGLYDIVIAKYDSAGNVLWANRYGTTADEQGMDVKGGTDCIYMTGNFAGATLTLGGQSINNIDPGTRDMFIAKLDTAGNIIWTKAAGAPSNDFSNGIGIDNSGNIYITGNFSGSINFGGTTLVAVGGTEVFLAKYDSSGQVIWAVRTGGSAGEIAIDLCTDDDANIYLTGNFGSTNMTFAGSAFTYAGGVADLFILKYDSAGNEIWGKCAGGTSIDIGYAICMDPFGNVSTTGHFNFSMTLDGTTLTSLGLLDIFIVKHDATGNLLWAASAGATGGADIGYGIASSFDGGSIVTGYFGGSSIDFGSTSLINGGQNDVFVAKIDTADIFAGMNQQTTTIPLSVFPNPASDFIHVAAPDMYYMEIYNCLGKKVLGKPGSISSLEKVDIGSLTPGLYFIRAYTSKAILGKLLMKN